MLTRDGGTTSRRLVGHANLIGDLEAELAYAMADRAAERLVFGEVCPGSGGPEQSDLARATKMTVAIDTLFGLGVHGPLWIDVPPKVVLSDPEARARVRARLEAAQERATTILAAHRPHRGADRLSAVPSPRPRWRAETAVSGQRGFLIRDRNAPSHR